MIDKINNLVFIVTNYNSSNHSLELFDSICDVVECNFRLVIVDNCSDELEQNKLNSISKNPKVDIVFSKKNLGYFGGLNLGLAHVKSQNIPWDFIIIGNNDLTLDKSFFKEFIKSKKTIESKLVVSPRIITEDGENQNPHVINKIGFKRNLIYDLFHLNYRLGQVLMRISKMAPNYFRRGDEDRHAEPMYIHQGYGACYILTSKFFQNFDSLDNPSFLMYEEFFLSNQLESIGKRMYYLPNIKIYHKVHSSTSKLPGVVKWRFSKESHKIYRKLLKEQKK